MAKTAILMVSGGSDSTALLEMACAYASGRDLGEPWQGAFANVFAPDAHLHCLHINHMLRGDAADADEAFVVHRCEELGIPCEVRRVDVRKLAAKDGDGIEAAARGARYAAAEDFAESLCAQEGCAAEDVSILTAHTLDDRVETFLMRALVGTGPGGLASIPRKRGRILRPLLDATREELHDWLRGEHPGAPDEALWREDATNTDGSNFRSQVRMRLIPQMCELRPGFERSLARTLDLMAEEEAAQDVRAQSFTYRNLAWDGEAAHLPVEALRALDRPAQRRALRQCLLVVNPQARLESKQIERVLDHLEDARFSTEVDSGIRVQLANGFLEMR